jgi:hypothetical protein
MGALMYSVLKELVSIDATALQFFATVLTVAIIRSILFELSQERILPRHPRKHTLAALHSPGLEYKV